MKKRMTSVAFATAKKSMMLPQMMRGREMAACLTELAQRMSIPSERIAVIPNAADHLQVLARCPTEQAGLITLGHLEPRKNLELLLRALAVDAGLPPDFEGNVIGTGVMTCSAHSAGYYTSPKWLFDAGCKGFEYLRGGDDPTSGGKRIPRARVPLLPLGGLGLVLLHEYVNALTMWLTLATFVGYAIVYTVILKPATPQNIVIGGASGAMPPVLGWAAVTGDVTLPALMLFAIVFYDADPNVADSKPHARILSWSMADGAVGPWCWTKPLAASSCCRLARSC